MELKSDDGRRRVSRHLQMLHPDRKDREQIAMRVIARRRTWTAIAGSTEIGSGLQRSLRQLRALRIAGAHVKLIVALTAESKIGGQNVGVGKIIAVAEAIAPDRECHTRLLLWSSRKPRLCQIDVACSRETYAAVVA